MGYDNEHIEELIFNALFGSISKSQQEELDNWRKLSQENELLYDTLLVQLRTRFDEPSYIHADAMKKDILARGFDGEKGAKNYWISYHRMMAYAAVFVLAILSGYGVYMMQKQEIATTKQVAWITKHNPPGVKSRIILPDSSIVYLNADSRLTYAEKFSDTLRYLVLEGEAYFEVQKDSLRPFRVKSNELLTEAIGTSFNITNYPEKRTQVALLTGKVKVSIDKTEEKVYLDPYQQVTLDTVNSHLQTDEMTGNQVIFWKDNIIKFEDASFLDVVKSLERTYGVSINYDSYFKRKWRYSAEFKNQSLEIVLQRIGYSQEFDADLHGKQVNIFSENHKNN